MLTKKAKYGIKAMLHLSRLDFGASTFAATIAEENELPKKFLDAILAQLRDAGMLMSKKGRAGGYRLARRAEDISLGSIIRVLDGPLAPVPCASKSHYLPCSDCRTVEECEIRLVMLGVRDAISNVLDNQSLADVRDVRGDTMASFVYQI
ncbi:Rrf2 family transcriptional regulator [Methylopila sp. M107]|uniref:RrF2 family transcriptional regulator n=1 Tax=Methylopila sp. M107 TaxID=1101190 RepID=UPI00036DF44D|nr:Rrf2 family transcriptional regulator [Methylopila sp. M107]